MGQDHDGVSSHQRALVSQASVYPRVPGLERVRESESKISEGHQYVGANLAGREGFTRDDVPSERADPATPGTPKGVPRSHTNTSQLISPTARAL